MKSEYLEFIGGVLPSQHIRIVQESHIHIIKKRTYQIFDQRSTSRSGDSQKFAHLQLLRQPRGARGGGPPWETAQIPAETKK